MKRTLLKLLPLGILLVGAAAFALLASTGQAPQRRQIPFRGPLVEAVTAPLQTVEVLIEGQGTVRPTDQIELVPQVSGLVVWKAPQLEVGGFFARGDLLLRIDPRDYELAVTRAAAAVARGRYELDLAREESEVARQEWELLQQHQGTSLEAGALVLRLPQVRAAEAELLAAGASLDEARLRLSRTEIRAPFTGRARTAELDVGQYLNANQPAARIYSIERAEIVVPVHDEDMAFVTLPGPLPAGAEAAIDRERVALLTGTDEGPRSAPPGLGPRALINTEYAGQLRRWEGRVARAEAELDARSRMVHLIVEVERPYDVVDDQVPLLVGMFVDVQIIGAEVEKVRVLPRTALRQGDVVWTTGAEGALHVRPVQVVHVRGEEVLVRVDMGADDRFIVSQLSGVTDGMKVRLRHEEARL